MSSKRVTWWVRKSSDSVRWFAWNRWPSSAGRYFPTHAEAMAYADKAARS